MSVSITAKLNNAASEFAAGESIGFGLRLGQQYFDSKTKKKEWTNYQAVIFAKKQSQIDFYRQSLVEGAIVAISGKEQKVSSFDGNNGQVLTIEILNASLDNVFSMNGQPPGPQQSKPQQPAPQGAHPQSWGDPWIGLKPAGQAGHLTIDQIKADPSIQGNAQAALNFGWVVK